MYFIPFPFEYHCLLTPLLALPFGRLHPSEVGSVAIPPHMQQTAEIMSLAPACACLHDCHTTAAAAAAGSSCLAILSTFRASHAGPFLCDLARPVRTACRGLRRVPGCVLGAARGSSVRVMSALCRSRVYSATNIHPHIPPGRVWGAQVRLGVAKPQVTPYGQWRHTAPGMPSATVRARLLMSFKVAMVFTTVKAAGQQRLDPARGRTARNRPKTSTWRRA
jgi:hypothetical protein